MDQEVEAERHYGVSDVVDLDLAARSAQRLVYRRCVGVIARPAVDATAGRLGGTY